MDEYEKAAIDYAVNESMADARRDYLNDVEICKMSHHHPDWSAPGDKLESMRAILEDVLRHGWRAVVRGVDASQPTLPDDSIAYVIVQLEEMKRQFP